MLFLDYANDKNLTEAEKDIIQFLIEKKLAGKTLSIRAAANDLFVSTATIIRLCKKLGFSGYSEFIYNLNLKVTKMLDQEVEYVDSIHQPLIEAVSSFKRNYKQTIDSLDETTIELR